VGAIGDAKLSDGVRIFLQLAANILGCGFVTVVGAAQLGEYFMDRHWRHIFAALAWFVLVPVLILRTAGVPKKPLLDPQIIADGVAIGWALCLLLGLCWGIARIWERKRERQALRRLQVDVREEC